MEKRWKKTKESHYSFFVDNNEIGEMEFLFNSSDSKAIFKIDNNEFTISRKGFWKGTIEISDKKKQIIAKAYTEKWYSNKYKLEYNHRIFELIIRNNSLAEWAILENNKDVLIYGLTTQNGKAAIKINTQINNNDYILDALLWYLFMPIALENMGDNFTYNLLTV